MVKNGVFEEIIFLFQYVIHMERVFFLCRIGFFEVFFGAKLASLSYVYFNYIQKNVLIWIIRAPLFYLLATVVLFEQALICPRLQAVL